MENKGDSTQVVDDAVRHDFSSCGPSYVDQVDRCVSINPDNV